MPSCFPVACTRRLDNARCCCLLRSTHASATTRRFSLWPGTARERTKRLKRPCSKQLARLEADTAVLTVWQMSHSPIGFDSEKATGESFEDGRTWNSLPREF